MGDRPVAHTMVRIVQSVGVDLVNISRVEAALARWGERFLRRVYTPAELAFCRGRAPELAVRFAGKEAVSKALGTGLRGVAWREIEILANTRGAPSLFLYGRARTLAEFLEIREWAISLSHSRDYAIASVIGGLI